MIKKGIISNISESGREATVILPNEDNVVTPMLPFARHIGAIEVGNICAVAFYETDVVNLADGVIIAIY